MTIDKLTVRDQQLLVHAHGGTAPIQLMGARLASAPLRDDWTDDLLAWLPTYRQHGLNSAVIFVQGSSGGWTNPTREYRTDTDNPMNWEANAASFCPREGEYVYEPNPAQRCHQAAFHIDRDYAVDEAIGGRTRRIVEAMDELGMIVVIGIFYFRTFDQMSAQYKDAYDFRRAARNLAESLRGYNNIIWYPYNEYHLTRSRYGSAITDEQAIAEEIKAVDPNWLVGGADPALDVIMFDSNTYMFDRVADYEQPVMNVETFALGAGGNARFSGRAHEHGIWDEEGRAVRYSVRATRENPATKQDFYREIDAALERPSYHLFAHLQGWYQGAYPTNRSRNFMGLSPGQPDGPALTGFNFYNSASPHDPVLVDDDNRGQGRAGSRGVRWYYEYLRDQYSRVKHPYFDDGAWDLERLITSTQGNTI